MIGNKMEKKVIRVIGNKVMVMLHPYLEYKNKYLQSTERAVPSGTPVSIVRSP
jgi:hypothetical protein